MGLEIGTRLGAYEVVAPPGAGGIGEVYRATDTRLGRQVAIKVFFDELRRRAAVGGK
jgi:serine/threonine protein kinase